MKPVSDAMIQLILTQRQFAIAELFTVRLRSGLEFYYTNSDVPFTISGTTYLANTLRFEGLQYKLSVGLEVDEQTLKIDAYPDDTLGTATFIAGVEQGLLDGATIIRKRAFWTATPGVAPFLLYQSTPLQVVTLFTGLVSEIEKIGRTHVELKVKSPLKLLEIDMPRNTYQPSCLWSLYDDGCGLTRATFTTNFAVVSASVQQVAVATISPSSGGDGLALYAQGRLLFTSGVNNGLEVTIANNDSTIFYLRFPLVNLPEVGDTFAASQGCSKLGRGGACELKFNNLDNFRGFPKVPPVVLSV